MRPRTFASLSNCSVNASDIISSDSRDKSTKASTVCCIASSASSSVSEIPELHGSYAGILCIRYIPHSKMYADKSREVRTLFLSLFMSTCTTFCWGDAGIFVEEAYGMLE